jgi:metallo-beta-lactamase family protein
MLTGGRVLHHALRILPDPDATLVFVGFQANGTRGRHIQDGAGSIRIMRSEVPVRCNVETVEGFSAHADRDGIMRWLSGLPAAPKRVFLTHGEPTAAVALSHDIKERFGWDAHVPELNESIELS